MLAIPLCDFFAIHINDKTEHVLIGITRIIFAGFKCFHLLTLNVRENIIQRNYCRVFCYAHFSYSLFLGRTHNTVAVQIPFSSGSL